MTTTQILQWGQDEWVWAGVSGWLIICNGRITVDTPTVKHVAYWSSVTVDRSRVQEYTERKYPLPEYPTRGTTAKPVGHLH